MNNIVKTNEKEDKVISVRYGDIIWVNLGEVCGSEQGGMRPAIVISNDKNNKHSSVISIVPISSSKIKKDNKSYLPTHIPISPAETGITGITRESVVMCEQVRMIDKLRILSKSGHIYNKYIINALNKALTIQFNMV